MVKSIIEVFKDIFLRHKGVRCFKYQSDKLNNAQGNDKAFQVFIDDNVLSELNIETNIVKSTFEIYILATPTNEHPILEIQDYAYTIAVNFMGIIERDIKYDMSVYDFSIITLSHYTDSDSSGVRLTLMLETPNPLNLCTLDDNFNEEPYEQDEDKEIDVCENNVGYLDINPIKLKKNR